MSQVHRRTLYDDKRGVSEPLNETGLDGKGLIIRGRHHVLLGSVANSTVTHRLVGEELMLKPYQVFVRDSGTPKSWIDKYETEVSWCSLSSLSLSLSLSTRQLSWL